MAKQNGHKATLDSVVEAIERMSASTNERFDRVNDRLEKVNDRLERVIDMMGGHWRELEKRVEKLEHKVG